MPNSLSGRFLILTVIFVMLAEIFIFVPSVARFREDYLLARLERAQIASLALEADDMISPALEVELLENAEVYNVVLRRDEIRQLALSSPIPSPITATYDLRNPSSMTLIADAMRTLFDTEDRIIRVIGNPVRDGGLLIEVTMDQMPLRDALLVAESLWRYLEVGDLRRLGRILVDASADSAPVFDRDPKTGTPTALPGGVVLALEDGRRVVFGRPPVPSVPGVRPGGRMGRHLASAREARDGGEDWSLVDVRFDEAVRLGLSLAEGLFLAVVVVVAVGHGGFWLALLSGRLLVGL